MRTLWPPLFAIVVLLVGCQPKIEVRAAVELTDGKSVDPTQVAVRARALCHAEPGTPPLAAPDPGAAEASAPLPVGADESSRVETVTYIRIEDGLVAFSLRGGVCSVAITGWYDATRDGVVGPGDYVGSLGPVEVHDRGIISGNLNDVGPLRLAPVSS